MKMTVIGRICRHFFEAIWNGWKNPNISAFWELATVIGRQSNFQHCQETMYSACACRGERDSLSLVQPIGLVWWIPCSEVICVPIGDAARDLPIVGSLADCGHQTRFPRVISIETVRLNVGSEQKESA
jgi:hypothetical protein